VTHAILASSTQAHAAKAAYTDALAHDVDLPTATAALETLPPDPKKNWAERWGDWVQKNFLDRADDVGRMLAFGAAVLLAIAVGAIGLLRLLARVKPLGRWLARRRWLRRFAHRPLVIGAIDGDDAGVLWQIRDALGTASAPIGGGVDLATGTDNSDQVLEGVGGALAKLPQGVLLAGAWRFVRLLVARTPLTVEGKTLPHGRRGVSLSLSVGRGTALALNGHPVAAELRLGPYPQRMRPNPHGSGWPSGAPPGRSTPGSNGSGPRTDAVARNRRLAELRVPSGGTRGHDSRRRPRARTGAIGAGR
jgi:hypothetical protein